jgi:hypothetical protein
MWQQWIILQTSVHQISSESAVYISTVILAAVWELLCVCVCGQDQEGSDTYIALAVVYIGIVGNEW